MPLRQLKSMYEKRKNTLNDILKKSSKLDKSRKDQIIGAISEIDILLKTIETLRDQEIEDNRRLEVLSLDIRKLNPLNAPIIRKISERIRIRFDESSTKRNLMTLFIRKSETRIKYQVFSKLAKDEGYEHIAKVFSEFSEQEFEHARMIHKILNLDKTTPENIRDAARLEEMYQSSLYADFEGTAKQESFDDIAEFIKELTEIEAEHEKTFLKLLKVFHEKRIFRSEHIVRWKCKNCGFISESREAPRKCKVCGQHQGYFSEIRD